MHLNNMQAKVIKMRPKVKGFRKAIRDSKWWFFIPFAGLVKINDMTKWIFEPDTYIERGNRFLLTWCLTLIDVIIFVMIIGKFKLFL